MKQVRHKKFEQNLCLIKNSEKKCRPLGMPSQQGIDIIINLLTKEMRETESIYKLLSMVNKNDLQHVDRVSSGQQRMSISRIARLVALSLIFTKQVSLQ
jgi:hypothetical protein